MRGTGDPGVCKQYPNRDLTVHRKHGSLIPVDYSTAIIKSALAARRWRYRDLAEATRTAEGTVQNICCGTSTSRRGRAKIEAALGIEIWPQEPREAGHGGQILDRTGTTMQAPSGDAAQPLQRASKVIAQALMRLEGKKAARR